VSVNSRSLKHISDLIVFQTEQFLAGGVTVFFIIEGHATLLFNLLRRINY